MWKDYPMMTITIDRKVILVQSLITVAAISGMVLLPFLVHLIPFSGSTPLGAYLLPMFISPLVAAFYLSPVGLLAAAFIAPLVNHALTGIPSVEVLPTLIIELVVFSLILSWIFQRKSEFAAMSTFAFIAAKLSGFFIVQLILGKGMSWSGFVAFLSSIWITVPGLLVLFLFERLLYPNEHKDE
jgi:hypothetical protein